MSHVPDTRGAVAGRRGSTAREVPDSKDSFTSEIVAPESFAGDTDESDRKSLATNAEPTAIDGTPIEEFGPYIVYERVGQGGMATVHRAEKRGIGFSRPVALKRLFPHVAADPELVKLFVDEARLVSHLHHANIAQTYELGRVGDTYFIAMEYASGPTLSQIIRQCQAAELDIPPSITVSILTQVCDALDYAHHLCDESGRSLRIIHRDVSPANIVVSGTGIVKLIDFGIAKATTSSVKTQTGFIKGKFGYIAPEYITGKIDARVDLFAVGVIAHEMLSGRRLFEGKDDFETMANVREMVVQPPSRWNARVAADLDAIVMTALERDPARRWQSAAVMQGALAAAARSLGVVVGSQQLVEWVEWAFDQAVVDSGRLEVPDGHTDRTSALLKNRPSQRVGSSLSIQVEIAPEIEPPTADAFDVSTTPGSQRAAGADLEETSPVERVEVAHVDRDMRTVPTRARARAVPVLTPTVPNRAAPADSMAALPTPTPTRISRPAIDGGTPARTARPALPFMVPGSAPRASKTLEMVPPPPELPSPLPAASRPTAIDRFSSGPQRAPRASRQLDAEPAPALPGKRRSIVWLILLMIALGATAMAATYYWPAA